MPFDALRAILFFALLAFCITPWASPPIALALGLALALTAGHPFAQKSSKVTKILLQVSVVGLGFGMNLQKVVEAGRTGLLFTFVTIAGTLMLGFAAGYLMGIGRTTSHLISSGTAICGGSAIAAVGPVVGATDEEMSVSLGTVFVLNSIALFVFPVIGHRLGLTQSQFGVWSAIAIHDTSSVVGAAAKYGNEALQIATTVKLTRALWIVPLTLVTAFAFKRKAARIAIPWFILWFLVASIVRTNAPSSLAPVWGGLTQAAKIGLTITLFLIGASLSRRSLKSVGVRPLVLGVVLWIAISCLSLWAVMTTLA
ncbi:MAG TPA: putative sulfate exporter family transporter [Thermoanaerobaculia bacterium]|nr:putative sulfate exporter family transporter [Thermoanaerobaculia bacterium]